jgi:hypothetical protein
VRQPEPSKPRLLGIDKESARIEIIERLKFQVSFAETMFRSLMLVNGGAIVGLFTFIGNLDQKNAAFGLSPHSLWTAFTLFCCGLATALVSIAGAYFSQQFYYEVTHEELLMCQRYEATGEIGPDERGKAHSRGGFAQIIGVSGAVASMLCFMMGAGVALSAVIPG